MTSQKNRRDLAIITALAISISSYFILVRHHHILLFKGIFILSLFVFILGMLSVYFAAQFLKYWLLLGKTMGKINAYLILSIFFFLILTPYSFLRKLFSKEKSILEKQGPSQYTTRNYKYLKADFEKLW